MVLRTTPPGEDATNGVRARPIAFTGAGSPPGEDGVMAAETDQGMIAEATKAGTVEDAEVGDDDGPGIDFLRLVKEAEAQALLYQNQNNRRAWSQAYRAWHNEHFSGSKYLKPDWRNRSKIFVPKTRSAVRKDMAAVAASLFNNVDAITCMPGNEGDKNQRAAAELVQEVVNYRSDRVSGKAAFPWFAIANGARQDALLTGVCLSKQSWKLELRRSTETDKETGKKVESWVPDIDRPNMDLIPSENYIIDPAADWTNPCQDGAYVVIKWPMRFSEIRKKQQSPIDPWLPVAENLLRGTVDSSKYDMEAIRRARESGIDRFDETNTGYEFQVIWVYETFMKVEGEDWTFLSVADRAYLTQPMLTRDKYPEQFGERPLSMGYGSLEAHRIFPMSPVESWQQLQLEINDLRNLALDQTKQNTMPITKIVRGRQIDIDQVKKRSAGTAIIVTSKDDVTWEQPPPLSQSIPLMNRDLELEFDDLAGQFNGQTAENNNALSRTLGGLKLVSGSANAVQEFDIRVWIQTWAEPAIAQIVRLVQYYESDPIILGLCGERAQLWEKFGVNQITDDLLENEVLVRVSVGLGAGDPQQRLMKFSSAVQIAAPLLAQSPQFQSGEYQLDADAILEEVFGAAGYRDGGRRFIKKGPPKANPKGDLEQEKLKAEIKRMESQGKSSLMTGLAALAKVDLGDRALEADNANNLLDAQLRAHDMGHQHAHMLHDRLLSATDHGHRHGMAIIGHQQGVAEHQQGVQDREKDRSLQAAAQQAQAIDGGEEGGGGGGQPAPPANASPAAPSMPLPAPAAPPPTDVAMLEKKMDDVLQLLKMLLTQPQQQHGFPSNPYPGGRQ